MPPVVSLYSQAFFLCALGSSSHPAWLVVRVCQCRQWCGGLGWAEGTEQSDIQGTKRTASVDIQREEQRFGRRRERRARKKCGLQSGQAGNYDSVFEKEERRNQIKLDRTSCLGGPRRKHVGKIGEPSKSVPAGGETSVCQVTRGSFGGGSGPRPS